MMTKKKVKNNKEDEKDFFMWNWKRIKELII